MTGLITPLRLPAALAVLLALMLLWELLPATPPAPAQFPLPRPPAAAADDGTADAGSWTAQILARPLFRADRRPLADLPASADLSPPKLTAIIITAARPTAIFLNPDGSSSVLGAGGHNGAYTVLAITADGVRLAGPEGPLSLRPFATPTAPQAAPAPPAPPPPAATADRGQDAP